MVLYEDDDLVVQESFSPYSILEELKKNNLDPSIFETINETDFPKAPNFLEFAIGPQFLNTLILPKQIQIGTYLFCDFCPKCSKPGYINNLFDQSIGEIKDNVVFLEHGVCPTCKVTRYELIHKKDLIFRNELVGVCGQRCVPKDSLVYSHRGLLSLENIKESDTLTHGVVLNKIDSGILPALTLTTEYGYSLVGARDSHIVPMIKKDGDQVVHTLIKDCKLGDYLLLNRADFFSDTPCVFNNAPFKDPAFKYPSILTLDLAKVLGVLYSKRLFNDIFDSNVEEIYFGFNDIAKFKAFNTSYMHCFEWPPITSKDVTNKLYYCKILPYVQKWLSHIGFTHTERVIPSCILTAPKEYVLDFVLAFTGWNSLQRKRKLLFNPSIHSIEFIKQFRLLLLNLGYITNKTSEYEYTFLTKNVDKQIPSHFKSILFKNYFPVSIENIEETSPLHMMDVQIPDTNLFTADGFVHHNSGKTKLVALLACYVNHRFLKIPNPVRSYNQTSGDILMGTFSALSLDHSYRNLWQSFKGFLDSSPWFQNYHRFLKTEEKRLGVELFHELKTSMFYTHKHLMWNATGSQDRKMRGDTRIFGAIDELGWMISEENKKDLQNMNADAIYTALTNSLTTMRTKYNQVYRADNFDLPPILMANISSPSSAKDKIMRLLKDAKKNDRIYAVHEPTWCMNADYSYETLREEHAHIDEATFNRDFMAEPPLASNPYLSESRVIDKIATGPVFDNIATEEYLEKDFLGDYYKSVKLIIKKGDKVIPRLISFDLGSFKNSLSFCMFSLTPEAKPRLDYALVVRPDPKTKVRVNLAEFFENFTMPIVHNFKIKHAFFDRWQSLDQIERLKTKDVDAAIHSLTYKEMDSVRGAILSQSIIIPKMDKLIDQYVKEYIDDIFHTDAIALLGLQLLTVRDLGHKMSKPLLGDDDIFRAFCLGAVKLSEIDIKKEYLNNGVVKTNSGHNLAHLGVVRTRRGMGNTGGISSVEGENGRHIGSIRSRFRK
jgi:hypothetical protein